jgi:hypothetical protein
MNKKVLNPLGKVRLNNLNESKNEAAWGWLAIVIWLLVPNLLFNPYLNHLWKPPVPKPDNNCKTKDTIQECIVTFKTFEKNDKGGWIMYVEGDEEYKILAYRLPKSEVGKNLKIGVEKTLRNDGYWWTLKYHYSTDYFGNKIKKVKKQSKKAIEYLPD